MKVEWKELAERMKKLDYPENHTFNPESLLPTGTSMYRIIELKCVAKEVFSGHIPGRTLLDVGCNKGVFSFCARSYFDTIVGIDVNSKMIQLANDIRNAHNISNISFVSSRFEDFSCIDQFDVVHFGQCAHYLFRDSVRAGRHPLSFLEQAKKLAKKYIAIDGAFDGDPSVECDRKQDNWDEAIGRLATIEGYAAALRPEFRLIRYNWSGDGATRYMAIFERI